MYLLININEKLEKDTDRKRIIRRISDKLERYIMYKEEINKKLKNN